MLDAEHKAEVGNAGEKGPAFLPDELWGGWLRTCLSHTVILIFLPCERCEHVKDAVDLGKESSLSFPQSNLIDFPVTGFWDILNTSLPFITY